MRKKVIVIGIGVLLLLAIVGVFAATYKQGTIETARLRGKEALLIESRGRELGLTCILNTNNCIGFIARAEKNPQLKEALLHAKSEGIGIFPETTLWFSVGHVGAGYIVVNTLYSDEKIIAFITK